jgi:hypothetical protein
MLIETRVVRTQGESTQILNSFTPSKHSKNAVVALPGRVEQNARQRRATTISLTGSHHRDCHLTPCFEIPAVREQEQAGSGCRCCSSDPSDGLYSMPARLIDSRACTRIDSGSKNLTSQLPATLRNQQWFESRLSQPTDSHVS